MTYNCTYNGCFGSQNKDISKYFKDHTSCKRLGLRRQQAAVAPNVEPRMWSHMGY